ncbi:MAG: response regulator transcription factor [Anaerolineales bacterium]|nr:response regulator transcription factor [Anaerolineales bacterium]
MSHSIKIAIIEDHQGIIDGYKFRLQKAEEIEIIDVAMNGEELNALLATHLEIDILIMDINVPVSTQNKNFFPILQLVPKIIEEHPNTRVLIISMLSELNLIKELVDAGISGYVVKDDVESIRALSSILRKINRGELYFSESIKGKLQDFVNQFGLTNRQLEILSVCAAYPDLTSEQVAEMIDIASSSLRTTLSAIYSRLNVRSKAAAIFKAKDLGLIP